MTTPMRLEVNTVVEEVVIKDREAIVDTVAEVIEGEAVIVVMDTEVDLDRTVEVVTEAATMAEEVEYHI